MNSSRRRAIILLCCLWAAGAAAQEAPRLLFYAPFDGEAVAFTSDRPVTSTITASDVLLSGLFGEQFVEGIVGQGFLAQTGGLAYPTQDAFEPDRGTLSLWFRPDYDGTDTTVYSTLFGVRDWGLLYKYTDQTIITFGVIKDDGHFDYGCTADISHWRRGEWRHVAVTWDRPGGSRVLYLDGARVTEGRIPSFRPAHTEMVIGATWGNANPARGVIDEVWIWDRPLSDEGIARAHERTRAGRPGWSPPAVAEEEVGAPRPPTGPSPALPPRVNWDIHEPSVARTATRVRIPLSGYWRFAALRRMDEAAPREQMGFMRVPGSWAADDPDWSLVYGPDMQAIRQLPDGTPIRACMYGWYEREFAAPEELAGKRALLRFDSVRAIAEVWLNDTHLGRVLEYADGVLDVTDVLRIGERNTLAVFVSVMARDGEAKGIDQDVWLEGVPPAVHLRGVGLMPSVTRGELGVRAEVAGDEQTARATRLNITCTGGDGASTRLRVAPAARTGADGVVLTGAAPWPDARPWSPDDPFLYVANVRLEDADGTVLDEAHPFRFGFREFEIRGGDFYLNGNKTHLRGQSSPSFSYPNRNTDPLIIREWFSEIQRAGANTVRDYSYGMNTGRRFWAKDNVFDIADEMGVMWFAHLPDLRNVLPGWDREEVREGYRRRIASYVRRYRNHPSVIMWQQTFNLAAYVGDIAPFMLDTDYFPDEPRYRERARIAREAEAMLREIDPSLPILQHASGNLGEMYTTMTYLGFDLPLQEREEWPLRWSLRKHKPLMVVETGFPCILSYYRARAGNKTLQQVYASEPLVAEYTAMYLGERAYELEGEAEADNYDPANWGRRTEQIRRGPAFQAQKVTWADRCLRSWRTWDLSGIVLHVEIREGFTHETEEVGERPFDPREPRMYVERLAPTVSRATGTTPLFEALQRSNQPVLGYIGGPRGNWVSKDHAFFAGEQIDKTLIFINDRQAPIAVTAEWGFSLDGAAPEERLTGRADITVQPGETVFHALPSLQAPDVARRTTGRITLEAASSDGTVISDAFDIEVFPRPEAADETVSCVLVPGDGAAAEVLLRAGVRFREWGGAGAVPETDLLVIGRRAGVWTAQIEEAMRGGMNVLCFEQEGDEFQRFRLDEARARDTFVTAPAHPLLAGLEDRDFASWRGSSDLPAPPYPEPGLGDPPAWPQRFWRWGNTNCVATYAIERPQRIGFTALLSCQFDLLYTPLLEWRLGRGRALFCQLDVSNRYGIDPVATLVVDRALRLYGRPGETVEDAAGGVTPIIVGADAERLREALGVTALVFAEPPPPQELQEALRDGGVALLLADVEPHADYGVTPPLAEAAVFKTDLTPALREALPGLSNSDLFWKRRLPLRVLRDLPPEAVAPDTGVFAVLPHGEGRVIIVRWDPFGFEDPRQRTKSLRVVSALLERCGVRVGASLVKEDAPSPYVEEALDFDPHLYRRW